MHPNQSKLETRVHRAAEAALSRQQYVSAIDVLCGMGLLASAQVDSWRKGRVDFLERVIQGNLKKISSSMATFRRWAREKGLKPSETQYMRHSRTGTVVLQFSKSGDPGIEKSYRTHFVLPELSEKKEQRLQEKLNQSPKPVVFQNLREAHCSECGAEIEQGSFLSMELEQPLCLQCARLDDLEFLPSGDAALTRRASKYSGRVAVVVRFSRSRGRYERKGILVGTSGLEKAERECLEDADERAVARARGAERRRKQDVELAAQMIKQIAVLFPGCPASEVADIAEHTARRGSGRVGRTEAGRNLEESALTLAVVAAIRHKHTQYDELLASGVDRLTARPTDCSHGRRDSGEVAKMRPLRLGLASRLSDARHIVNDHAAPSFFKVTSYESLSVNQNSRQNSFALGCVSLHLFFISARSGGEGIAPGSALAETRCLAWARPSLKTVAVTCPAVPLWARNLPKMRLFRRLYSQPWSRGVE